MSHLRAVAALPRLMVLNLYNVCWTGKAITMGLASLAALLPCLRILNAPSPVLVRPNISPRTDAGHFCRHATCARGDLTVV